MNQTLGDALRYLEMNLSIIPIRPKDKRPLIAWESFQKERATEELAERWFTEHPDANVGIITGEISGIDVVDIDSEKGAQALTPYLPETFETPTARTPRGGSHIYVAHRDTLGNAVRFIEDCDFRGQGGYVVAPPSIGQNGKPYAWAPYLSMFEVQPAVLPDSLYSILINGGVIGGGIRAGATNGNNCPQMSTSVHKGFQEGSRDETLFHLANCLIKGGMSSDNALEYLSIFAANCVPPFPEKEVQAKIESAIKRAGTREINISKEVREFVLSTNGNFLSTDVLKFLQLSTRPEQKAVSMALKRCVEEGICERTGNRNGCFRRVETECEEMNFLDAETESVNIVLPFGLGHMAEIMPGNIILLAGSPNAGKTALLLNIIHDNMHSHEIHYFNSEMGSGELKKRLAKFEGISLKEWKLKAYERTENFGDIIKPGRGKLNIIDFLEIHENFYEIGGKLAEIHRKLSGAVAIVAIQKNRGTDMGLGGFRTLEKPRLALAMEPGILKIVKLKNWKTSENPNGKQIQFKIIGGCKFIATGGWVRE